MASKVLSIPLVTQYEQPFCLYACTSMVMKYFGIDRTVSQISQEVMFNFPGDSVEVLGETSSSIKAYLSDYGLEADIHREQGWKDIKKYIDKGFPIIVSVKSKPGDIQQNHAWVIRGYDDTDEKKIIYNNPWDNPGNMDPVEYDPDIDNVPGKTMSFKEFDQDYWSGPFAGENRSMIVVSYRGQGASKGNFFDWRGVGIRNVGRFFYHSLRLVKKLINFEIFEAFFESILVILSFVGLIIGAFQTIGWIIEAGGKWLVNKGKHLWVNGGIFGKILGGFLIVIGAIVFVIGFVIDFVFGVVGLVIDAFISFIDAIGSKFTGAAGGSNSKKLDNSKIGIGLNLKARPWRSRWGKNWEKISGSWAVAVNDNSILDDLNIQWKIQVSGWGVDNWSLRHSILEHNGSLNLDEVLTNSTNYKKRFQTKLSDSQGIRMSFGQSKCNYGGNGGLTRVKLSVKVTAKRGNNQITFDKSTSVWGLST